MYKCLTKDLVWATLLDNEDTIIWSKWLTQDEYQDMLNKGYNIVLM